MVRNRLWTNTLDHIWEIFLTSEQARRWIEVEGLVVLIVSATYSSRRWLLVPTRSRAGGLLRGIPMGTEMPWKASVRCPCDAHLPLCLSTFWAGALPTLMASYASASPTNNASPTKATEMLKMACHTSQPLQLPSEYWWFTFCFCRNADWHCSDLSSMFAWRWKDIY